MFLAHLIDIRFFANSNLAANAIDDPFLDKRVYRKKVIAKVCQPVAFILPALFVQKLVLAQIRDVHLRPGMSARGMMESVSD